MTVQTPPVFPMFLVETTEPSTSTEAALLVNTSLQLEQNHMFLLSLQVETKY